MSKKYSVNGAEIAKLEAAHNKVRASMTREQLVVAHEIDAAFEAEVAGMSRRLEAENALRAWAEKICGVRLDMSEIEEFRTAAARAKPGIFTFEARRGTVRVVKTAFGTVDTIDNYLSTLERTVIDITNNSQFTALPFSGLIKLAFKQLFKRSN